MNTEYDPRIQALFLRAEQEFDRESFAREIMTHIDRDRRRTLFLWITVGAVAAACLALLAAPLMSAVALVSNLLPVELVEIETTWVRQVISPVNSIAAAVAIGMLGLRKFYLWIFR
jgi:hypothetical protein